MRILPGIPLKSLQDLERKKELTSCESVLNSQRGEVPLDNLFLDMALGVLFRTVWVGYVGDRVDIFSWFRCLRWGCERDWVRLLCDNAQRILKLSLLYLPIWKKHPVKLSHQGSDSVRQEPQEIFIQDGLLCGICGNQTTLPMGQLPKSWNRWKHWDLAVLVFSLAMQHITGGRASLPSCFPVVSPILSLLPFLHFLSHAFILFKLGRKQGKRKDRKGDPTGLHLRRQLPASGAVGSFRPSRGSSRHLLQLLTLTESSFSLSRPYPNRGFCHSLCIVFMQWIFFPSPLSPVYRHKNPCKIFIYILELQ